MCIKLAVVNEGTCANEDIDVILKFEKGQIISHKALPMFPSTAIIPKISY